jgi:hypothetical protein
MQAWHRQQHTQAECRTITMVRGERICFGGGSLALPANCADAPASASSIVARAHVHANGLVVRFLRRLLHCDDDRNLLLVIVEQRLRGGGRGDRREVRVQREQARADLRGRNIGYEGRSVSAMRRGTRRCDRALMFVRMSRAVARVRLRMRRCASRPSPAAGRPARESRPRP